MRDLIGHTLGHYRIVEKIGAGGMGEVYRARDERLDRDVAIKVLPEEVAADSDRLRRFEREAKAVATLSHTNILEIFDFDQEGQVVFSVTELLEGETLREHLQRETGPLPWRRAVAIGAAVADGLGSAHAKGVVHRDIKPSNIFLCSDGRVKILDFGLAATHEVVDSEAETGSLEVPLTVEGKVLGTVGYMAPEQVWGEQADHRSDIFALGCVLYEMLTGERAFKRDTAAETMVAILREKQRSFSESGVSVPPQVAELVRHCLEKQPNDRFQSASEIGLALDSASQVSASRVETRGTLRPRSWAMPLLAIAGILVVAMAMVFGPGMLERLGSESEPSPIRSIAILPLENLTGDPEQAYFVDGLHDELIATFAQISGFDKVIARTSVMGFRSTDTPIEEIGRQLGVAAVIAGSVRRSGDTIRTTLQLIDARTEEHLWARNFDGELEDILALHSEVARAVASAVKLTLSSREEERFARTESVNHEAYEAYLMGKYLQGGGFVEPDLVKAIGFYQLAIDKDPDFARAYVGLASGYGYLGLRFRPAAEVMPLALEAAQRAIELDDADGEAFAMLGTIVCWWQRDWARADAAFRRALELQPNDARVNTLYTQFLVAMLRFDEAVEIQQRAVDLSPLSREIQRGLGWVYWGTRRYDEAVTYMSNFVARYPDAIFERMILSWSYSMMGDMANSVAVAEEARDRHEAPDDDPFLLMTLAWAYGSSGDTEMAESVLQRLHELRRTVYIPPSYVAFSHYAIGDQDGGYEWFRMAFEERHGHAAFIRMFAAMIPAIDADPRIHALIEEMNFPDTW
jgi:non-specific serine/threonine protein kinase